MERGLCAVDVEHLAAFESLGGVGCQRIIVGKLVAADVNLLQIETANHFAVVERPSAAMDELGIASQRETCHELHGS